MRTFGRILVILAVFALVMGITYVIVEAHSSSGQGLKPGFEPGNDRFASADGAPGLAGGGRPEFQGGERNESRDGGGWLSGAIKNVTILVVLIAVPREVLQRRKRAARTAAG